MSNQNSHALCCSLPIPTTKYKLKCHSQENISVLVYQRIRQGAEWVCSKLVCGAAGRPISATLPFSQHAAWWRTEWLRPPENRPVTQEDGWCEQFSWCCYLPRGHVPGERGHGGGPCLSTSSLTQTGQDRTGTNGLDMLVYCMPICAVYCSME